jgi:hypothetical protein
MGFLMNFLNSILGYRFSSVLEVDFFSSKTYIQIFKSISSVALNYLSPKQGIRPESFSETVMEVAFKIRMNMTFKLWRVCLLFNKQLLSIEGVRYVKILRMLTKDQLEILEAEKNALESLISSARNKNYLDRFDFFVASINDPQIKREHKILKDLFMICDPQFFSYFKAKLQGLIKIKNIDEINPLQEKDKLSITDINVVMGIDAAIDLLGKLNSNKIDVLGDINSKLEELQVFIHHPFFEELKRLCLESRSGGTIFLGDRRTLQVLNGQDFDCTGAMQQLFMGRICHIGIFVNPDEKGLHLSHVNRITKNHAVVPIKNPLSLPFSYALSLDIRPLIPSSLSEEQKRKLVEIFFAEFQRLATEEHPELPLGETRQHVKMLIMGHKTVFAQNLAQVQYPYKNTPTMCSSYVGITFLKAIQKMNSILEKLDVRERIPHPFGQHENLMNMDILRLLYLWKQLKVIKPSPISEKLAKVISSTSVLPS